MKHKKLLFISLVALTLLAEFAFKGKTEQKLTLHNIGINLGKYNSETNMAGDIKFTKNIGEHYQKKALLEFGAELSGPSGSDIMPHPTYILPLQTKLISPVKGKVVEVDYQEEQKDYEVAITPSESSSWRVSFDHVVNLTVKKGDKVNIGDTIAEVAPSLSSAVPKGFGRAELQVWKDSAVSSPGVSIPCTLKLLDESIKEETLAHLKSLATEWNKYLGENVYNEKRWVYPGCLVEEVKT